MADIFISYAREDRSRAQLLAEAFKGRGWSVWWDEHIEAGQTWDKVIEWELALACCVVVLWSTTSVQKDWVRAEADDGLNGTFWNVDKKKPCPQISQRSL